MLNEFTSQKQVIASIRSHIVIPLFWSHWSAF